MMWGRRMRWHRWVTGMTKALAKGGKSGVDIYLLLHISEVGKENGRVRRRRANDGIKRNDG